MKTQTCPPPLAATSASDKTATLPTLPSPPVLPKPEPNGHLARKVHDLISLAERLHLLRQRLDADGRQLPGFFLDPFRAALEFTALHAGALGALFGAEGWERRANSRSHFDWVKTLPDGLHLRIVECEPIGAPEATVAPATFATAAAPRAVPA